MTAGCVPILVGKHAAFGPRGQRHPWRPCDGAFFQCWGRPNKFQTKLSHQWYGSWGVNIIILEYPLVRPSNNKYSRPAVPAPLGSFRLACIGLLRNLQQEHKGAVATTQNGDSRFKIQGFKPPTGPPSGTLHRHTQGQHAADQRTGKAQTPSQKCTRARSDQSKTHPMRHNTGLMGGLYDC